MIRSHPPSRPFLLLLFLGLAALGVLLSVGLHPLPTQASGPALQTTPLPLQFVPLSDAACLECHTTPNMLLPLPSGEELYLTVDSVLYKTSVHGRLGYACTQCHTDISGFPHPELKAQNLRQVAIYMAQACEQCHKQAAEEYQGGDHARVLQEGKENGAVCSDCHGAHKLEEFGGSRSKIALTCRKCHVEIYDTYKQSVHGKALLEDFNPDVPTCVDCHGNHTNSGPATQGFHLFSPQICAKCHANEVLMSRYGINTDVFQTYTADFHGTTLAIFEKVAPDQETNKPACIDCHGVHNILSPKDAGSTVIKQNLLATCQRCHPEATPPFTDAWLSHYRPDLQHNPVVYLVNLFYKFFIPGTLGGMAVFVASDAWRRWVRRRKAPSLPSPEAQEGAEEE